MSEEQQIATLRDEIRRAGRSHRRLAWGYILCMATLLGVVSLSSHVPPCVRADLVLGGGLVLVMLAAAVLGYPWLRGRRLLPMVRTLTPDQAQRLYASLPATDQASRMILTLLVREIGATTELTPAAGPPDARGDEASPAEQSNAARLVE